MFPNSLSFLELELLIIEGIHEKKFISFIFIYYLFFVSRMDYRTDISNTGNILLQFPAPDAQPWDICLENDNLWIADYWGDTLYKVDLAGGGAPVIQLGRDENGSVVASGVYLYQLQTDKTILNRKCILLK